MWTSNGRIFRSRWKISWRFCGITRLFHLQPQNVLLTSATPLGDIRIVDFGLSRRMDSITEVREILGTPEYVGESGASPLPPPAPSVGSHAWWLTWALCFDSSTRDPELRAHHHGDRHVVSVLLRGRSSRYVAPEGVDCVFQCR